MCICQLLCRKFSLIGWQSVSACLLLKWAVCLKCVPWVLHLFLCWNRFPFRRYNHRDHNSHWSSQYYFIFITSPQECFSNSRLSLIKLEMCSTFDFMFIGTQYTRIFHIPPCLDHSAARFRKHFTMFPIVFMTMPRMRTWLLLDTRPRRVERRHLYFSFRSLWKTDRYPTRSSAVWDLVLMHNFCFFCSRKGGGTALGSCKSCHQMENSSLDLKISSSKTRSGSFQCQWECLLSCCRPFLICWRRGRKLQAMHFTSPYGCDTDAGKCILHTRNSMHIFCASQIRINSYSTLRREGEAKTWAFALEELVLLYLIILHG